jgi:hypothetical protein
MHSYLTLILYAALAEVFRRVVLVVLGAFSGPLSKIPGPFYAKFTNVPWIYQNISGNSMNVIAGHFEKYGPVIRMGMLH